MVLDTAEMVIDDVDVDPLENTVRLVAPVPTIVVPCTLMNKLARPPPQDTAVPHVMDVEVAVSARPPETFPVDTSSSGKGPVEIATLANDKVDAPAIEFAM